MSSCLALAGTLAISLCAASAAPKSEVKDAIKKLKDQPNYSWTFTPKTTGSESAARQGPVEGKSEKAGLTWLKGTSGETSFEAVAKGTKYVVKYNDEWVAVDEEDEETGRIARRLKSMRNLIESADELADKTKELKKDSEGVYSSDLTAEGAKELFGRLGRRAAAAETAEASVKFWLKDGTLTKFQSIVKGKMTVGEDKREVELSRTVTVEIKDIGSTKITVPEEAAKKL